MKNGSHTRVKPRRIAVVFGTRPELIKLAPVIHAIDDHPCLTSIVIHSSQHRELVEPFLETFGVRVDHDLDVMQPRQTPNAVLSRVLAKLGPLFTELAPDVAVVQGDTTTTLAASLAAFHHGVRIAHVEAGLRSGDRRRPYPEEMNRRLVSQLADVHFAPTQNNVDHLLREGVDPSRIWLTGNPIVDALHYILSEREPSTVVRELLDRLTGRRIIALTTHRRESFGEVMRNNLSSLSRFAASHDAVTVVFPVHPNPEVRAVVETALSSDPNFVLTAPMSYPDFIHLLSHSWLVVSDSGGVQEEAPSLGKRLIVLRCVTERPEVVEAGVAKLAGDDRQLTSTLERALIDPSWEQAAATTRDLYGTGDAAKRIAERLACVGET